MTQIDIRKPVTVSCAGGVLRFDPDGQVTLLGAGSECSVAATGLELSNLVELWCGESWACFIGLESGELWCAWPSTEKIAHVSQEAVWFRGEYERFGFRLIDGCPVIS